MTTPHDPVVGPWMRKTRDTLKDAFNDPMPDAAAAAPRSTAVSPYVLPGAAVVAPGERPSPMALFAVHYTYDNQTAQRDLYRPAHRGYLRELIDEGVLLAAGAYVDDVNPGALLLFRAPSAEDVAARIRIDPFVSNGLVAAADIREWAAGLGAFAAL